MIVYYSILTTDVHYNGCCEVLLSVKKLVYHACINCVVLRNLQDVLDVLAMADRFGFVQLKEALSEKLASVVTLKNVLHLLLYADLYQASSFLNQCLTTVDRKAEEVLSSDAFLALAHSTLSLIISRDTFFVPEMMIYHSVVCWKDFNGVSKEELEEVLGCVRLSEIPPKDLFVTVEPAQLFKPTEITSALRVQIKPEFQQMKPRGRKGWFLFR